MVARGGSTVYVVWWLGSFSYLFAAVVIGLLLGLLPVEKLLRKHHRHGQLLPEEAKCSRRKFAARFSLNFLSIFLHNSGSIDHSDLGIIEKIFPFCRR